MEQLISFIDNNDICQISTNRDNELKLPFLFNDKRIFVSVPYSISTKLLAKLTDDPYVGYANDKEICYNLSTKIVYTTPAHLKYKIFRCLSSGKDMSFADIIIMMDTNIKDHDNIFTILSYLYSNDILTCRRKSNESKLYEKLLNNITNIKLPKLVLLSSKIDKINKIPYLELPVHKNDIKIIYERSIDIYNKIRKIAYFEYNSAKNVLIHVPDDTSANILRKNMNNIIILNNHFDNKLLKDNFIAIAINLEDVPLSNVDVVIDTMKKSNNAIIPTYTNICKTKAENHIKLLKSGSNTKCYRFILENEYYNLPISHENTDFNINKLIIDLFRCNINPLEISNGNFHDSFLKRNIKPIVGFMNKLGVINDEYDVLPAAMFINDINLKIKSAVFLWKWIENSYPIYPGIVITCLLDRNYIGFSKDKNKSPLLSSIHTWESLIHSQEQSAYNLVKYYNKYLQNKQFSLMLKKVSEIYNIICKNLRNIDVSINKINIEDIMNLALPLINIIYQEDMLIIKNNHIIQPHENIKYVIDRNVKNKLGDSKIIPFHTRNDINPTVKYIDSYVIV